MSYKKYAWAAVYGLLLFSFTVYLALDTFVLSRVYSAAPAPEGERESASAPMDEGRQSPGSADAAKLEGSGAAEETASLDAPEEVDSYTGEGIRITVAAYREYGTDIYVADIRLTAAGQLRTAFAQDAFGRNVKEKTSETAGRVQAALAINGDFYGARERGYVVRNGTLYRDTASDGQEDLVIYQDSSFEIITEGEISAGALIQAGAQQVLSFGPALIEEGRIGVTESDEVGKAKASNPRTAVGIVEPLHYCFVVSDGRTDESQGLTLYQLASFMQRLGVKTAYNLDGGGSSTMYFNGALINHPTTDGRRVKERSVSDIVYIAA